MSVICSRYPKRSFTITGAGEGRFVAIYCHIRSNRKRSMIECKELAGNVIRICRIDKDGSNGPEIHIEFTDQTMFSVCLKTDISIETKSLDGPTRLRLVEDLDKPMNPR
jgi:hypothetical protein